MKRQKDGLYHKQITINGKRHVFTSKDRNQLMLKIAQFREEASGTPKFAGVAERWKEEHWNELKVGSLRAYTAPYNRLVEKFGNFRLNEITPASVQNYLAGLGKVYSYKTVSNEKILLNQIFKYAIVDLAIDVRNPCTYVSVPKNLPRSSRTILTDEQVAEIRATGADEFQLAPLILFTGLRCSEAVGLLWKDVDFDHDVIHVRQAVQHVGNAPKIGTLKTSASYRRIPLVSELKRRLEPLRGAPDEFVVSGAKPLTKSALDKRWKHWAKDHGLFEGGRATIDRHQIRHHYTTRLYEAGVDLKSIQRILGHADVHVTLQTYTHLTDQQFQQASEKIESFLK